MQESQLVDRKNDLTPDGAPQGPSRHEAWKRFDRIATRYDLLNHLLSANIDRRWRRCLVSFLPDRQSQSVLDLATGTGDQAIDLLADPRVSHVTGIDLAERMLQIGRKKIERLGLEERAVLRAGDAEALAFDDGAFDAVTISFGIRNMNDVRRSLSEMHRVLKPGGRAIILEFSLPNNRLRRSIYLFYLRHILPRLGALISGDSSAYRYLNETIETFPRGDDFCRLMRESGFARANFTPLTGGIATIYAGDRE